MMYVFQSCPLFQHNREPTSYHFHQHLLRSLDQHTGRFVHVLIIFTAYDFYQRSPNPATLNSKLMNTLQQQKQATFSPLPQATWIIEEKMSNSNICTRQRVRLGGRLLLKSMFESQLSFFERVANSKGNHLFNKLEKIFFVFISGVNHEITTTYCAAIYVSRVSFISKTIYQITW